MTYNDSFSPRVAGRRGAVLLVVITLLTLFSAVGLSFVFYADAELTAARFAKEAESLTGPDVEPELALAFFLGKLIYGDSDADTLGLNNGIRGHDLTRGVYDMDHVLQPNPTTKQPEVWLGINETPFNGTGRLHYQHPVNAPPAIAGVNDYQLVNYTYFAADGFLRDPGRMRYRAGPADARTAFAGGLNVPHTYPDLESFYLAVVRADGTVACPSFHRHWLFNPGHSLDDVTNPNWTNEVGKYLTPRPRPKEHPGFPYPEDAGGDVKNWPFGPGGNDSIWIDVGAPVMTAPDGRKYKMLFAPLIIDLDGRINLNIAGNLGPDPGNNPGVHYANQVWGRHEIDPSKVLPAVDGAGKAEWPNYLRGRATPPLTGRYGGGGVPNPAGAMTVLPPGPWYAPMDFDGVAAGPMALPAAGSTSPFPTFPGGYDNPANELVNHPAKYNPFLPAGGNRRFRASELEALLRFRDKGSPALSSELFRLLPLNLQNDRLRQLVTTDSFDFDRPGALPYITEAALTDAQTAYLYNPALRRPVAAGPVPFPDVPLPAPGPLPPAAGNEFAVDWRGALASLQRLDLNRPLISYPALDPATGRINLADPATKAQFDAAEAQRRLMARQIYTALAGVTGAQDPNRPAFKALAPTSNEYRAARWLAQLTVNLVDYIDEDDYMTVWRWDESTGATANFSQYVMGTEIPRLVLNEVLVQLDNDPTDPGLQDPVKNNRVPQFYRINVWAELLNPLKATPAGAAWPRDGGDAILQIGGKAIYDILIAKPPAVNAGDGRLRDPSSNNGKPIAAEILGKVDDWGNTPITSRVLPVGTNYSGKVAENQGFYVLGPNPNPTDATKRFFAGADPFPANSLQATALSEKMSVKVPLTESGVQPLILLRRLANPHLEPNDPTEPGFNGALPINPYITIDYVTLPAPATAQGSPFWDTRLYKHGDPGEKTPPPVAARQSRGRTQPYAALTLAPQLPNPPEGNRAQQTFFRHNARELTGPPQATTAGQTLKIPFDWLVHLDRPLVSPVELLHVSGVRPWEMTRDFQTAAPAPFGTAHKHVAPWFDPETRLYRFLEFVRTRELWDGARPGGRVAGKVNINTIWEEEVFLALCAPRNAAEEAYARQLFAELIDRRTPPTTLGPRGYIGPTVFAANAAQVPPGFQLNRPITSLAIGPRPAAALSTSAGQYPNDTGIENTLLQPKPGGNKDSPRLFGDTTKTHPYQQLELLSRLFNNVTTRSNVFAVFVTVGFFEVTDETSRPVKLGREIGRSENRQVRHRFFAVVDRSAVRMQLTDLKGDPTRLVTTIDIPVSPGGTRTAILTRNDGGKDLNWRLTTGAWWTIQKGTSFAIEPNTPNEETVYVEDTFIDPAGVQAPTFTVRVTRTHLTGSELRPLGHPGPWARYDPRKDSAVVPHFSVID